MTRRLGQQRSTDLDAGLPYLDVGAGDEPRLVGQNLVDVVQDTQAGWRRLQAVQPQRVAAHPQEVG